MDASIITIGDELLIGQVINTNSAWLAAELTSIGFTVKQHISISDSRQSIEEMLRSSLPENDLLIITGGLGPTNDDITKKVLADFFGYRLVLSADILRDVEQRIKSYGSTMNSKNREQAMFPEGAKLLKNNHGTAPGMWFETGEKDKSSKVVISLPGVPSEMKGIFNDFIKTELSAYFKLPQIIYRTVMLTGIAEAHLAEKLEDWENALPKNMSLAYLPSPEAMRLRLGIRGENREAALIILEEEMEKLHKVVPDYIYGYESETIESVVGKMIESRGSCMSCAESCTGGTIAQKITAIPGCSAWFRGGIVAYSNEIKKNILGVSEQTLQTYGAVSEQTVTEMVKGALKAFKTDYAVATSGIAGPTGGTDDKPVGTVWTAAAGPGFLLTRKYSFGNNRNMNIRRSATAAFSLLRKAMLAE